MKATLRNKLAVCLIASGLSAAAAHAMSPPTPEEQEAYQRKLFTLVDGNNDGKITEKEFAIFILWDEFQRYDLDGDGKVSQAEYEKMSPEKEFYAKLDPSGRGHVTFEDCLSSAVVRADFKKEWAKAVKELGLKTSDVITLNDLPDLTPGN